MPARTELRVVIVGGVAGGMSAATRLRRLNEDARITVFEKGPYTSFANCGIPYALGNVITDREKLLLQTPESFKKRFNIDVHVNTEVAEIDRKRHVVLVRDTINDKDNSQATPTTREWPYDKLILAQGAAPIKPDIPGVDLPHVFQLTTISDLDRAKAYLVSSPDTVRHAAVIGGGFIGLEAAENLRLLPQLETVTVIERTSHVLPPLDGDIVAPVHACLRRNNVRVLLDTTATGISATEVTTATTTTNTTTRTSEEGETKPKTETETVRADIIIMAVGIRPRTGLAQRAGLAVGTNTKSFSSSSPTTTTTTTNNAHGVSVNAHMQTLSDKDVYAVGDMVETEHRALIGLRKVVALAGPANRQGRIAADHICGRSDETATYRGSVGAAICKVFDLTVGIVGLSVEELERRSQPQQEQEQPDDNNHHETETETTTKTETETEPKPKKAEIEYVSAHPPDHASYYPGAKPLTLKLIFSTSTSTTCTKKRGKILGAQAVGSFSAGGGIDKRLDVISTAMQAGMTVFDLEHLELTYAPPYGAAKDAVNMVGFIAGNVLRGDVQVVHGGELRVGDLEGEGGRGGMQVVDVRTPAEFERNGRLRGARNVPVNELRGRIGELDRDRKTLVYCQVGYRGYLAQRILKQRGFGSVVNLDGGFKSVREAGLEGIILGVDGVGE